eukprot:TRINITY_DN1674_c1_g1_i1.p1 TRINITY_DN1674_c1_g1~~TRINITY_DN1674_c1_g1_i1.p1  ORF type:complete len:1133 (+),score=201.45 TRINITY_DN1674_c1_g1_i1:54-3401(+)
MHTIFLFLIISPILATIYYGSPDGSDNFDCLDANLPCASFSYILNKTTNGDLIMLIPDPVTGNNVFSNIADHFPVVLDRAGRLLDEMHTIFLFLIISPILATIYYGSPDGSDNFDCLDANLPCASFSYILNKTTNGDLIMLIPDPVTGNNVFSNIADHFPVVLDWAIFVHGKDVVFDGLGLDYFYIWVEASKNCSEDTDLLSLKGITFRNVVNGIGESIFSFPLYDEEFPCTIIIEDCHFENIHSYNHPEHPSNSNNSPVVSLFYHNLMIKNSTFHNISNLCNSGDGGAIVSHDGDIIIEDSGFSDCFTIDRGGVLRTHGTTGNIEFTNVMFHGCSSGTGGAVYSSSGSSGYTMNFKNITTIDCASGLYTPSVGGAFELVGKNQLLITDSTFIGNSAIIGGGGLAILSEMNATIRDCILNNNSAGTGGGIYSLQAQIYVSSTIFTHNKASEGSGIASISESFLDNLVFKHNNAILYGGGLLVKEDSIINNCEFEGNTAMLGGGILVLGGVSTINDCTFVENYNEDIKVGLGSCEINNVVAETISVNQDLYVNSPMDLKLLVIENFGNLYLNSNINVSRKATINGIIKGNNSTIILNGDSELLCVKNKIYIEDVLIENNGEMVIESLDILDHDCLTFINSIININEGSSFVLKNNISNIRGDGNLNFAKGSLFEIEGNITIEPVLSLYPGSKVIMSIKDSGNDYLECGEGVIHAEIEINDYRSTVVLGSMVLISSDVSEFNDSGIVVNSDSVFEMTVEDGDLIISFPDILVGEINYMSVLNLTKFVLVALGIIMSVIIIMLLIKFGSFNFIRLQTYEFLFVIMFGVLLGYLSCLFWIISASPIVCIGRIFMPAIAFTFIFPPIIAKTFRVWYLYRINVETKIISTFDLAKIVAIMVTIQALILVLWAIDETPSTYQVYLEKEGLLYESLECTSGDLYFYVVLVYDGILLLAASVVVFLNRKAPPPFNETLWIGYTIYTTLLISLVSIGIGSAITYIEDPYLFNSMYFFLSYFIVTSACVFLYFPKFYIVIFNQEKMVKLLRRFSIPVKYSLSTKGASSNSHLANTDQGSGRRRHFPRSSLSSGKTISDKDTSSYSTDDTTSYSSSSTSSKLNQSTG